MLASVLQSVQELMTELQSVDYSMVGGSIGTALVAISMKAMSIYIGASLIYSGLKMQYETMKESRKAEQEELAKRRAHREECAKRRAEQQSSESK